MPSELPGDIFVPYLGPVDQTNFRPLMRLQPWKMSRCTLDIDEDKVDTPSNAVPRFRTSIGAKEGCTGTIENATFDAHHNIFGSNPFYLSNPTFGGLTTPLILRQSLYFRAMFVPLRADVLGGAGGMTPAGLVGQPIMGQTTELIDGPPAGQVYYYGGSLITIPPAGLSLCYIFLALKVTRIRHEARAEAGQPFSFDFESVYPFMLPGESSTTIASYGFVNAVNDGNTPSVNGGFF